MLITVLTLSIGTFTGMECGHLLTIKKGSGVLPGAWEPYRFPLMIDFFFFFLIWVLRPFQEYFTYIEPIVHRRWAKTGEPGEKPPDHP